LNFKKSVIVFGIFAVLLVSSTSLVFAQTGDSVQIPDWMKNNAKWWAEGNLSDGEFVDALEFLIKEKIIKSPEISVLDEAPSDILEEKTQVVIPSWIKNDAKAWPLGQITDSDFLEGIKFMIKEEIIRSPKIKILTISDDPPQTLLGISEKLIEKIASETESDELSTDEKIALATDSSVDTDLDGIPDEIEVSGIFGFRTDPNSNDSDNDGLSDLREYWWNTDPNNPDTNDDSIMDGESIDDKLLRIFPYDFLPQSKDRDGDGIPTKAERFDVGTNFKLESTDGDKYNDGTEFFDISTTEYFFPSYVPADPFSPATPDIKITVDPDVKFWPGTTETWGTMDSEKKSYTLTNSEENTDSYSVGVSTTVTAKATVSPNPLKNEASLTVEVKAEAAMKQTTTFSQNEASQLMTSSEAYSIESTELGGDDTVLQMWFTIQNVGDDLLTDPIREITLNLFLGNDEKAFHTETFENTITNIEPTKSVTQSIEDIPLNLDQAKRFLANEGVRVEVEHFEFGKDQVYLFNAESSNLRLVTVSDDGIKSRFVNLPPTGMNLEQVFETANINYQRDESGAFTYIDNMESQPNKLPYKTLLIYHTPDAPVSSRPSNVDDMLFENGDVLVIKHQIDSDGDHLTDRDELLMGTNLNEEDTDGDGLLDGFYSPDDAIGAELTTFCDETKEKNH